MSATWRHSAWDGYYSDEYSDDDYTDQDDYTDCDDSGSEYDDEWLVYDNSGRVSGSEYSWEEDYDAFYLNDNIRSWHTGYSYMYTHTYMYRMPSYGCESKPVTKPRNNASNGRSYMYPTTSLSTPKNDCDRRQCYNNVDNTQRSSYGANRRTNDRAASMPPISYGRAEGEREKSTSPRNRRAVTCEPRLLFAPTPGAKSSVAKGREFEDYFKMGVERARGNITSKVEFQKKLDITPG